MTAYRETHALLTALFLELRDRSREEQEAIATDRLDDDALREELLAMLQAAEDLPPVSPPTTDVEAPLGRPPHIASSELHGGDRIGPYTLLRWISDGGFASVYLAQQDAPVRRLVALKVGRPVIDDDPSLDDLVDEARVLAMLEHPGIARIYDAGRSTSGEMYLAMEWVRGSDLTSAVRDSDISASERVRLFLRICRAVAFAHRHGVIHGDLKPANILVTIEAGRLRPKIIDFGLGAIVSRTGEAPLRVAVGSYSAMAPEQADPAGSTIDERTDVFALGLLLYELLCDRPARSLDGLSGTALLQRLREPLVPPPCPHLRHLAPVVARAVRLDPNDRFQSVEELADAVRHARLRRRRTVAPPQSSSTPSRPRRRWMTPALATIALLLGLASIVVSSWNRVEPTDEGAVANELDELMREHDALQERLDFLEEETRQAQLNQIHGVLDVIEDDGLRPTPSERREASLDAVLADIDASLDRPAADDRLWTLKARALTLRSDLLRDRNEPVESLRLRKEALEIWTARVPESPDAQAERALAMVRVGDIRQEHPDLGDGNGRALAEELYRRALAIDEDLHAAFPTNTWYADNLCWSYERVAHIARLNGGPGREIRRLLRRRLILARELHQADPENLLRLYNLVSAHLRIASMALREGRLDLATEHATSARPLARQLIDADPSHRLYGMAWCQAFIIQSEILDQQGRHNESRKRAARAYSIARDLAHFHRDVKDVSALMERARRLLERFDAAQPPDLNPPMLAPGPPIQADEQAGQEL